MTNGEAQLIAAMLTAAESSRLGGVGAPLDPTTLKDKDVNQEVAIMFKEYLAYILAGNHPDGILDPQWQNGFPLIPGDQGGDHQLGDILGALPPNFVQTILTALAPLVAGNPALAGLLTTLGPIIMNVIGAITGGGSSPSPAPVTPPVTAPKP
jgi:hypothetical protein